MIKAWEHKYAKLGKATAEARLRAYLGSLALGRNFGETMEAYLERKGYVEFYVWAHSKIEN